MTRIVVLEADDGPLLTNVAADVFDNAVVPEIAEAFLADPRHHIAVAVEDDRVVGMATGVHYIHPDKPPELWVNEVGVASTHRRQGLARRLLEALFEVGRALDCAEAWVLTEGDNEAARALYSAAGGSETTERPVMFEFRLDASRTVTAERATP